MRVVYLAHPLAGDVVGNVANAKRWLRWIYAHFYVAVIADWVLMCELLDDYNPQHRTYGLMADQALASRADELWLTGGAITKGMISEREVAHGHGRPAIDLTTFGRNPPEITPSGITVEVAYPDRIAKCLLRPNLMRPSIPLWEEVK